MRTPWEQISTLGVFICFIRSYPHGKGRCAPQGHPSDLGAPSGLCGLLFARNVPLTFHRRPEGACMGLGSGL